MTLGEPNPTGYAHNYEREFLRTVISELIEGEREVTLKEIYSLLNAKWRTPPPKKMNGSMRSALTEAGIRTRERKEGSKLLFRFEWKT